MVVRERNPIVPRQWYAILWEFNTRKKGFLVFLKQILSTDVYKHIPCNQTWLFSFSVMVKKMTTMLKIITLIFVVMCNSVLKVYPRITCTHGILRCKMMALENPELEIQRVVSWHMEAENTVLYEQSVFLSAGPAPASPLPVDFEHLWDLNSKHKGFEHLDFALFWNLFPPQYILCYINFF